MVSASLLPMACSTCALTFHVYSFLKREVSAYGVGVGKEETGTLLKVFGKFGAPAVVGPSVAIRLPVFVRPLL